MVRESRRTHPRPAPAHRGHHPPVEPTAPSRASLDAKWLPNPRWVAERNGEIVGWTALSPVSARDCYAGVAESSIYVADGHRGTGIGKALVRQQVIAADEAGL